jgi:HAD superfamily hydrolase (TIGR01509 family)
MLKIAPLFIVVIALCSFAVHASAQSADQLSQGGATDTSLQNGDASGGVAPAEVPVRTEPSAEEVPAVSSASPTQEVVPRSAPATATPRSIPAPVATPVSPKPALVAPKPLMPAPMTSIGESVSASSMPEETTGTDDVLPLAIAGAVLSGLLGLIFAARAKGNKEKKSDPCGALKKQFESSKIAYDTAIGKITLQELLIAQLEKEIDRVKEKLEGEVKKYAKKTADNIIDDILEKDRSGTLKEVAEVGREAKAVYDDLLEKYTQAKELLEILKNRQRGFADEVREREAAFNMCTQGVALAGSRAGGGKAIVLPEGSLNEKIILVDAVRTFVNDEGKIIEAMHKLLETYSNRKILLTGADDAQMEKCGLHQMPYEVFTLKHDLEKTNSAYYEKMLEHFGLSKDDVVYIEHNEEAIKSAQSLGITTYHYDADRGDMVELKKFLDAHA